jgi:hypothetical protein
VEGGILPPGMVAEFVDDFRKFQATMAYVRFFRRAGKPGSTADKMTVATLTTNSRLPAVTLHRKVRV